jgi:hypothetical protein
MKVYEYATTEEIKKVEKCQCLWGNAYRKLALMPPSIQL